MKNQPTAIGSFNCIDNITQNGRTASCGQPLTDISQQHHFLTQNYDDMSKTNIQKTDIYERATNKIIALLEKGEVAWRRTWGTYGLACNYKTKHVYTGVNLLFLNLCSPHSIPYYVTFRQAKELGGKIKKGAKAEYVYFYKGYYKDEEGNNISEKDISLAEHKDKAVRPIRFLKCYPVFNIEDTEGIEWEKPAVVNRPNDPIEACETILKDMPEQPNFQLTNANQAFYIPEDDLINVPDIKQFENSHFYYRTTFHEVGHWTGHTSRLARVGITEKIVQGSDRYAEEELIAELTSNYILNIAGVATDDVMEVSSGYLNSWIGRLKEDPKILFRIAPKAQEAVEFILGKKINDLFVPSN